MGLGQCEEKRVKLQDKNTSGIFFTKMTFAIGYLVLAVLSTVAVLPSAQQTGYNSDTQICCNGSVTNKTDSESMSCCGSASYDYKTQLCCMENQVVDRPSEDTSSHACCYDMKMKTSTVYDYTLQECCDGEPINKPNPSQYYGCCNRELFDWTKQRCCGGEVVDHVVGMECCGGMVQYDINTQVCCESYGLNEDGMHKVLDYSVQDNTDGTSACCGTETYDMKTHTCCNNDIKPKKTDIGNVTWSNCCGGEPYDHKTELCCSKWGETAPNQYGEIASALHPIQEGDYTATCCGLEKFDYTKQVCCVDQTVIDKPEGSSNTEWMSCCGQKVITNHTTQLCYEDEIYNRKDYNEYVCGGNLYDTREESCCGKDIISINSTIACCYGAQEKYDTTTNKCCFDRIEPLTEEDREANNDACCAVENYNDKQMYTYATAGR